MLIKSADDKSRRLALLQDLQKSPLQDARQKEWLRLELRNLSAGLKGEREAAFHLDGHYKDGQNNVLLHDSRPGQAPDPAGASPSLSRRISATRPNDEPVADLLRRLTESRPVTTKKARASRTTTN